MFTEGITWFECFNWRRQRWNVTLWRLCEVIQWLLKELVLLLISVVFLVKWDVDLDDVARPRKSQPTSVGELSLRRRRERLAWNCRGPVENRRRRPRLVVGRPQARVSQQRLRESLSKVSSPSPTSLFGLAALGQHLRLCRRPSRLHLLRHQLRRKLHRLNFNSPFYLIFWNIFMVKP